MTRKPIGGGDGRPVLRIGGLQLDQPPVGVHGRSNRIGGKFGSQRHLLAQEVAQHAIDQCLEIPAGHFASRRNSLIDDGVRCIRPGFEAIEGDQQQGTHFVAGQRLLEQPGQEEIAPPISAQAAVDEILHGGTGRRLDAPEQAVGQTLPAEYGGIDARGLQQGVGE